MGPLKITFSGECSTENMVLGPSQPLGSQPLIHLIARVKPASSKNMNGFHQLPALSPSKTHVLKERQILTVILSRIQPLWLPPIATRGNPHLSFNSIRTSFPIHPVPETDSLHRCCPLTLVYLTCSPTHLSAKSCSCHADNSERLFPD